MASAQAPRVIFMGMDSRFSTRPLLALIRSGARVEAVVKPLGGIGLRRADMAARVPGLMTRVREHWERLWQPESAAATPDHGVPEDPFAIAEAHGIPCYVVGNASGPRAERLLRRHRADVYCVAFFNQLLRANVLALPRLGAINLHPSLLPAYRGPSPLFWVFRDGQATTGLTVHLISPGEDDGDILAQEPVPLTDGLRGPALLDEMARLGELMAPEAVWSLFEGRARPTVQAASLGFRKPRPSAADCRLDFTQPCRQVFNFVRGVGAWMLLTATVGHDTFEVVDAEGLAPGEVLPADHVLSGTSLMVQCADGVVVLKVRGRAWG